MLARISGGACAQVTSGGDRQRVAGGAVAAGRRQAAVHLDGAPTSGVARRARAPERVDEVDARAGVDARRRLAFVDVRLTATPDEARCALTPVRAHLHHNVPVSSTRPFCGYRL